MNQYIIDEKFLKELGGLFFLDEGMLKKINDTFDHPYNPQAERETHLCAFCGQYSNIQHNHHVEEIQRKIRNEENSETTRQAIRKLEREKVLDDVETVVANLVPLSYYYEVSAKIKELRQECKQEEK